MASLPPVHPKRMLILPFGMALTICFLGLLWHTVPSQADLAGEHFVAETPDLELVGHLGGVAGKVLVSGDQLYLAQSSEFSILNIADPTHPDRIGWYLLPGNVTAFDVLAEYAFVGWERCNGYTCTGGLEVIDISQPASPERANSYALPGSVADVFVVNEAYLYGVWKTFDPLTPSLTWGGIKVFSLTNLPQLIEINNVENISPAPSDMAVANGYGYLVDGNYLTVYDLTDPVHPVGGDSIIQPGRCILISGTYAYVGGAFFIVSLADPAHPVSMGSLSVGGQAYAIDIQGGYAYVSEVGHFSNGQYDYGGMHVMDVSNPVTPTEAAYLPLPYGSKGVAIRGNIAYVSEVYNGISAVDISTPNAPEIIGKYRVPGEVSDVVVARGWAYTLADYSFPGASGLWVSNLAVSSDPRGRGYHQVYGSRRLDVEGNYAYVLTSYYANNHFNNYIRFVDVVSPSNPIRVGNFQLPVDLSGALVIAVQNQYAYVTQPSQLTIVDARSPSAPVLASAVTATQGIMGVAVANSYAYVSDGGLRVFETSDPASPNEIGAYPLADGSGRVAVWDHYAYVMGGNGLHVLDVADPVHPIEVGVLAGNWGVYDIAADSGYVFLAADPEGLIVVNTVQPEAPFVCASYSFANSSDLEMTSGVDVWQGYVYVADFRNGLFVFRYNPLIHNSFLPMITK